MTPDRVNGPGRKALQLWFVSHPGRSPRLALHEQNQGCCARDRFRKRLPPADGRVNLKAAASGYLNPRSAVPSDTAVQKLPGTLCCKWGKLSATTSGEADGACAPRGLWNPRTAGGGVWTRRMNRAVRICGERRMASFLNACPFWGGSYLAHRRVGHTVLFTEQMPIRW